VSKQATKRVKVGSTKSVRADNRLADAVGPPERKKRPHRKWMARLKGSREWQLSFSEQNQYDAKQAATVQLRCEPWQVELAPYDPSRQFIGCAPARPKGKFRRRRKRT
jgi:hypothetical protein